MDYNEALEAAQAAQWELRAARFAYIKKIIKDNTDQLYEVLDLTQEQKDLVSDAIGNIVGHIENI